MSVANDRALRVVMQLFIFAIVSYRSTRSALVEAQQLNHSRFIRQTPGADASTMDIAFDLPDITTSFQLPIGVAQLEAFKSVYNDKLQQDTTGTMTSKLRWVSVGVPHLSKTQDQVNASKELFHFSDNGFSTYIDMMTQKQRSVLASAARHKYERKIADDQIVNLILSKFQCTFTLHDEVGSKYLLLGRVSEFRQFPLRMDFDAPRKSIERIVFFKSITDAGGRPDLHFDCHIEAGGGKVIKTNTLTITSDQQEQLGFEEKLFGAAGSDDSNNAYVTRNQMSELAHEMYSALNIVEDYEIPETQFGEAFVNGLISQLASSSFAQVPIDTVLASLSKYGFDINADLQPDVIKRDLGSILKVEKKDNKSRIIFDTAMSRTTEDSAGGSAGVSGGFGGITASVNAAYEWSKKRTSKDKSLSDQLHELNTYSQNDVKYEIEGNRVVPKSLNVARITRSKLKKTLTFSRIRIQKSQASFERNFRLYTKRSSAFESSEQIDLSIWRNLSSEIANNKKLIGYALSAIQNENVGTKFAQVLSAIRAENIGTKFAQVLSAIKVCPSGFDYLPGADACYRVIFQSLDWYGSSQVCKSVMPGVHLAAITNAEKQQAIKSYLVEQFNKSESSACLKTVWPEGGKSVWISGQTKVPNRCYTPYVWKTLNAVEIPFKYTNWIPGEPNCSGNVENCAHIA